MDYIFIWTSFNLSKGDTTICNSMEESWWHYAKQNEEDQKAKYTSSHLYMEPKKSNTLKRVEPWLLHGGKVGKCREMFCRMSESEFNVQKDYTEWHVLYIDNLPKSRFPGALTTPLKKWDGYVHYWTYSNTFTNMKCISCYIL